MRRSIAVLSIACVTLAVMGCSSSGNYASSPLVIPTQMAPSNVSKGTIAYLDSRNGFRDLTFGDPPTSDMILVEDASMKCYERREDDLTIGEAKLYKIGYCFHANQLVSVSIKSRGYSNSRALLAVLQEAYGPGTKPNRFMERYLWTGKRVKAIYDENRIQDASETVILSWPLWEQKEADEKAKAKKAADKL